MKRTLSIIIAILLTISCFIIPAFATETEMSEAEQLTEKACIAFPEYENIIRGEGANRQTRTYNSEPVILVTKETRAISETEQITYFGYSDGTAMLVSTDEDYSYYNTSNSSSEIIPGGTSNTITITVKHSGANGVLKLKNVAFYLLQSGYDRITSTGTIETSNGCSYRSSSTKFNEDSSGKAFIKIDRARFPTDNTGNGGHVKEVNVDFYVGQNRMTVDLTDFD